MRFYKPDYRDKRVKTWFAVLPVTIDRETRWLEKVTVEQYYLYGTWGNRCFVESEDEECQTG